MHPSLLEFFETRYLPIRCRAKPATIVQYRIALRWWAEFTGDPPIHLITDEMLARFLSQLAASPRRSARTCNNYLRSVLMVLRFAGPRAQTRGAQGLIAEVPFAEPLRASWHPPRTAKPQDLASLWRACDYARRPRTWPWESPDRWWRAFLVVAYYTGLRLSAVLGLDSSDVEAAERVIVARAEAAKTRREQRLPANAFVLGVLRPAVEHGGRLFPWPHNLRALFSEFQEMQLRAGIERPWRFHDLRRTCATVIAAAFGPDAATLQLGHTDSATTRRSYLDLLDSLRPIAERMPLPPRWRRDLI